ncbi:MAG: tRNA preQ1(34) S-adenosylmethionine ribosyltransferase-isomerase QueA [bacterium]
MKLQEFRYDLPEALIAQYPLTNRANARLLVVKRDTGEIRHRYFYDIIEYFSAGDVLVLNNTKVYKARFIGKKETGGKVDILVLSFQNNEGTALIRPSARISEKIRILLDEKYYAEVVQRRGERFSLKFSASVKEVIEKLGKMPLPPYIKRIPEALDENAYQTIYAEKPGSVAAPTAGLHFTDEILNDLQSRGVRIVYITLHIGPGTFKPIKSEIIEEHYMEPEYCEVSEATAEMINRGKRIFGVGTSVARTLEFIALKNLNSSKKVMAYAGKTDLFIYPGFRFRVLSGMVTNFHLPCSTPLLLVCAFAGRDLVFEAYKEAIAQKYRFLSYGDAMLIL